MNMHIDLNTLVLLAVAFMNAVTLYYTRRTEKNTNSLVTNLVVAEKKSSHAEGVAEGVAASTEKPQ